MPPDFVYQWTESGMFLFVLLVTGAVAAIIHLLFYRNKLAFFAISDLSPVIQTLCGTLFVLSVTFLANSVWQTEARAREHVNQEARSIRNIVIYAASVGGTKAGTLDRLLADYANGAASEWPDMAASGGSPLVERQLAELYLAAINEIPETNEGRLLQQRMLDALDSLTQARQARLSIAKERVSEGQWFTVIMMALLLLAVIAICHPYATRARAIALSVITLAISLSLFVILAHDRPFVGYLAVSPKPILDAVR